MASSEDAELKQRNKQPHVLARTMLVYSVQLPNQSDSSASQKPHPPSVLLTEIMVARPDQAIYLSRVYDKVFFSSLYSSE